MKLHDEQIAQFATDGYLLLRGALADADLDRIAKAAGVDRVEIF